MPAIGFICPDGEKITFQECLDRCRLEADMPLGRCKAKPLLASLARRREWTGHPSTTQLLNGTREVLLEIKRDYYFRPDSKIYAFVGTKMHSVLEKLVDGESSLSEQRLIDDICSGQFDFYDADSRTLWDYKTWGSYKASTALGVKKTRKYVPDKTANGKIRRRYDSAEKKWKVIYKLTYVTEECPLTRAVALLNTSIQLSDYRRKLNAVLPPDKQISNLAVQIIVRDYGLESTKEMNLPSVAPILRLNGISDRWVQRYLTAKRERLMKALELGYAPRCRPSEAWNGVKCAKYCSVADHCADMDRDTKEVK